VGQLVEFTSNHPVLVLVIMTMGFAVIVNEIRVATQGVTHISVPQAVQLMNRGAVVVDVRKADEFGSGHMVNAKNIPVETLDGDKTKVDKYKKKNLLMVCESGTTSGRAANVLRKDGFDNVFSVKGGIRAWREDKLPLVK